MNLLKKQSYSNFNFETTRYAEKDEIIKNCIKYTLGQENKNFSGPTILNEGNKYYIDGSEAHTIVFGASSSKKTRLEAFEMVYSTIDAGHSAIISDVKEEIYERTSGYAKKNGYNIFTLNLRNPKKSHGWNILSEVIYLFENGCEDEAFEMLSDLIHILFKSNASVKDPYWDDTSALLATAIFKTLLIGEPNKKHVNIKNVMAMRSQGILSSDSGELFDFYNGIPTKSDIFNNLSAVLPLPNNTFGCVMSTFDSKLKLFSMRPDVTELFSKNDIEIEKLVSEKTLIYIITPDESRTFNSLVSMFIKSVYSRLIKIAQNLPNFTLPRRVNFILDEFANMPTIPNFDNILTCARSRNIRFFLFVQSLEQLENYYKDSFGTIIGNCSTIIYLYSREQGLLKYLSELCGQDKNGKSLISTSELQRFSKEKGEALILLGREYPFITNLLDIDGYNYPKYKEATKNEFKASSSYNLNWNKYLKNVKKYYSYEYEPAEEPILPIGELDFDFDDDVWDFE